jgi:transposase-like protein
MLSEHRELAAAKAFFRSAKTVTGVTPDRVTTDGYDAYPRAIRPSSAGRSDIGRVATSTTDSRHQRPMSADAGPKSPRWRHAICRCHDELRNFHRCRFRMCQHVPQHVPAATQRWQHMRKTAIALHILAIA